MELDQDNYIKLTNMRQTLYDKSVGWEELLGKQDRDIRAMAVLPIICWAIAIGGLLTEGLTKTSIFVTCSTTFLTLLFLHLLLIRRTTKQFYLVSKRMLDEADFLLCQKAESEEEMNDHIDRFNELVYERHRLNQRLAESWDYRAARFIKKLCGGSDE